MVSFMKLQNMIFESWLPKLKKDGIMLFHDVASKNDDFGVVDLWAE